MSKLPDDPQPFQPTGYQIDWKRVMSAPVQEITEGRSRRDTTVGEILKEILPHRFVPIKEGALPERQPCSVHDHFGGGMTLKTPTRSIHLDTLGDGNAASAQFIETLIELDCAVGDDVLRPTFFFYDSDDVRGDVHDSFSFFVVNNGRIVSERVTFSRYRGNGFTADFFKECYDDSGGIWRSDRFVLAAQVRWWYRKFYEETEAGQLTTLRDDASLYHHVPEWRQRADALLLLQRGTEQLGRIRVLLAGVIVLLVLDLLWR
jgi:hypothetical protein